MWTKLNKILGALLLAQVVIFGGVILLGSSSEPQRQKPESLLPDLDKKTVTRVVISEDGGKQAVLEKKAGRWVLQTGGDYPAKQDKVDELLDKLAAVTAGAPVAEKATYHRALEVADGKFQRKIEIERSKGEKLTFFLGSSPALKKVHFRKAGEDPVYLAGDLSAWEIGARANTWVDTDYLKLERDEIVSITLKNAQGELALSKGADGKWALAGLKPEEKLDTGAVDSLVSSAASVVLQEPVGKTMDPAFKLDPPQALLAVVTETRPEADKDKADKKDTAGEKKEEAASSQPSEPVRRTYTVRFGAKKGDDGTYAKASTSQYVVLVGSWTAETFTKKKRADLIEKPDDKDKPGDQP